MNKCWTLMPPRETTETTGTDLIMQRSSQARDIANGDMKKGILDFVHQTYSQSIINTYKAVEYCDWSIVSKMMFVLPFAIITKRNTDDFIAACNKKTYEETGGFANKFSDVNNNDIGILLAKKLVELHKVKGGKTYFGGSHPNYADVEIFGLLNFMEMYEPTQFNDQLQSWVLDKWYNKMKNHILETAD